MLASKLHTLLQPVGNGTLPGSSTLSERNTAAKGTSSGAIANTHDTDVGSTSNSGIAGHTCRHLHLHFEFGAGSQRDTLDPKTRNVLSDGCRLHSSFISLGFVSIGSSDDMKELTPPLVPSTAALKGPAPS